MSSPTSKPSKLPLLGVLLAAVLFAFAAARYPGGYDQAAQSFSSLFQPSALNGESNSARPLAIAAVLFFCLSLGFAFYQISKQGLSAFHRSTIQTGGIGAMVYTFLLVTPMHNSLLGIALLFYLVTMLALLHMLFQQRRLGLLAGGGLCLALTLCNASMYYANVLYGFLPSVQKLSLVLWAAWLLVIYFRPSKPAALQPQD